MHCGRLHLAPLQVAHQAVGTVLGAHEYEVEVVAGTDLAHQLVEPAVALDAHKPVLDVGGLLGGRGVLVARGVVGVHQRDPAGLAIESGREEERLAVLGALGHHAVHRRTEAHVEHAVGLVKHQDLDVLE